MNKFDFDILLFSSGPKAYAPRRIQEECANHNLKFKTIKYKEVDINFTNSGFELRYLGNKMPSSKSVFLRGVGEDPVYSPLKLALIKWYKKNKAKVINHSSFTIWPALDKTSQYIIMNEVGLPIVESFSFGSPSTFYYWAGNNFPFIAKDITGSCGIGVFKINQEKDIKLLSDAGFMTNIKIKTLIFQKFLKAGEDLRVIVLGGKVLGAMKRVAQKGQYLTNFSQGGTVESYNITKDKKAANFALSVAKLFKLDYCGVDLMKNQKEEWVVLEVNRACQFEGFEKSTGINVAKKIVDFLVK